MKVLFVSAEVTPFAKVGGLADVVGALPVALKKLGVDARIMVPRYERLAGSPKLKKVLENVEVNIGGGTESVNVYQTKLPDSDVIVYVLENQTFISRGEIYEEHSVGPQFSELARFLFFSQAVVSVLRRITWKPKIVHCHDWHTGLVPFLLRHAGLNRYASVFTIHNLAYQGVWAANDIFTFLGLSGNEHAQLSLRDEHGSFNLLQQAITGSDTLNTVSPQYAKEVLTPEYGNGLEQVLKTREADFAGILNGIDTVHFNPETDRSIPITYGRATIERKIENKRAVHVRCRFKPDDAIPTFGFVGRLAGQKGIDLVVKNSTMFSAAPARLIVLGSGLPKFESELHKLSQAYPQTIYAHIGFDAALAQLIYAGCDFFLVPSQFEPCGIGQMIAMRYGTPTIVRATGGLRDTVPDVDDNPDHGLGFVFQDYTPQALWNAIERALACFRDPPRYRTLVDRCMSQDFSWDRSARAYLSLYERAGENHAQN